MMENENNFRYELGKFNVVMSDGELIINNCTYEEDDECPEYEMAREIYRLRQICSAIKPLDK